MTTHRLASTALACTLITGLGGCSHVQKVFANLFGHAKPVATADLGQVGSYSAEDRLYADAVKAIDNRNYGEALDLLQVARDNRPGDPRVLTAMGVVYDKLGRFDLSDRYYDQAEQADPGSRIVAMDRRYSMMLRNAGSNAQRMDQGPALAQAATPSATPSVAPPTRRQLARMTRLTADAHGVMHIGAPATARAAAIRTAANRPTPAPAPVLSPADRLYAQAVAAIRARGYGEAIGLLRQARDAAPSDARIFIALGVTYDHLGRFDLSGRYYDQAGKLDPGSQVLAQDRRSSLILQQHGGSTGRDDILLAVAPVKAPKVNLAKAPSSLRHGA